MRNESILTKSCKPVMIAMFCLLAIGLTLSFPMESTAFPTKEVKIISPWKPGGLNDTLSRAVAKYSSSYMGKPIIVENMSGGAGVVGNKFVERAKPDGYVLLMASSSTIFTQYVSYTPNDIKNLAAVIQVCYTPPVLVVKADSPWNSLKDFLGFARKNPNTISCANSGSGGSSHIYTTMLENKTGVKVKHVPYKGYAPSVAAVLGGHVKATIVTPGVARQHVKAGKLRVLGIASKERFYVFPDARTFVEQGVDLVIEHWVGLMGPKGTPMDRIQILADALDKGMEDKDFKKLTGKRGLQIQKRRGLDFQRFVEREDKNWAGLIKGLKF